MNNCTVCDCSFRNDNPNKIICDGICRQSFHAECVNFSKNTLLCYREMPNLQWLCDCCIIQTRSSNVSSPSFNKFNSTVVNSTSSPSNVQHSLIAAKCKRNRNSFQNAKPNPVFLVTRSPNVERDIRNTNESVSSSPSVNEMQPENLLVKRPGANGSNELTTSRIIQSMSQNNFANSKQTLKEPSELKTPPANSTSFADVLTKSSMAEPEPAEYQSSTIQPQNDSIQSQRIISSPSVTQKVVYVSHFHPSVTEDEVVNYLLRKNIITSAEDVTCKKLVSPWVNMDSVSFVSFKIAVSTKIFDSVVKGELWPEGVIAREFVKR